MSLLPSSGKTALKSLLHAITVGLTLLLSGCAGALIVGAGVGAGAFSYVAGSLVRVYEAEYQPSIRASITVMNHLNFKQKEESQNGLKTIVEGYLDDDTPVTIEVVYVDPGWTQIGVRTGYIGSNNLEISKQVHTDIANELKSLKNLESLESHESLNPPPTLQATSLKKKIDPAEAGPGVSQERNAPAPPSQNTFTTSPASTNIDTQSPADWQEKHALAPTEKRQDETEPFAPEIDMNDSNDQSLLSEPVSTSSASDMNAAQNLLERQEIQALSQAESNTKTFYFDPKSALTIHSGSYGELDEVISYLEKNPSTSVNIRAYTNSEGTASRNISLARKRVFEIREYLILNDISEERITAKGLGESNFLDSNSTERLEPLNHSVELTVR